jgi:acyl-CoA thioester hydrolase
MLGMARIKLTPPESFPFRCTITIRITDLNYGGHVGNDTLLSLVHEARMRYLHSMGYTEMNLGGAGLIMSDAAIEFKAELFWGEDLQAEVGPQELSRVGFDLFYRLSKADGTLVALVKTGMICFDYAARKVVSIPAEVRSKLMGEPENSKMS